MAFFFLFCFLVSVSFISLDAAPNSKLPKGFIQCHQNDPKFNDCVTSAINLGIPELVKGVPKLGLPSIDPLLISTLYVDQGTGPVNIKLNFTDLSILGLGSANIKSVKVDTNTGKIDVKFETTKPIYLDGTYSITGKVLVLPITGTGHSHFTLNGFKVTAQVGTSVFEKNGEKYWNVDELDFDFTVSKLIIKLENLFNGDKALGDNMNVFLNENWSEILQELKPAFRSAFGAAFVEIGQRFFHRVPIDQVFPKN